MTNLIRALSVMLVIMLAGMTLRAEAGTVAADASVCEGMSEDEARRHAREARNSGDHERAAECFLIAGDYARADRELLRAAADKTDAAERNTRRAADQAKSEARRIAEAFR